MKYVAICGSFNCTGKNINLLSNKDFIEKDVPKGTSNCPDCKHALRWVKEGKRRQKSLSRKHDLPKTFSMNEK